MAFNQLSNLILGILILIVSFFLIKVTLQEGRKGLEEINKNNNKSGY